MSSLSYERIKNNKWINIINDNLQIQKLFHSYNQTTNYIQPVNEFKLNSEFHSIFLSNKHIEERDEDYKAMLSNWNNQLSSFNLSQSDFADLLPKRLKILKIIFAILRNESLKGDKCSTKASSKNGKGDGNSLKKASSTLLTSYPNIWSQLEELRNEKDEFKRNTILINFIINLSKLGPLSLRYESYSVIENAVSFFHSHDVLSLAALIALACQHGAPQLLFRVLESLFSLIRSNSNLSFPTELIPLLKGLSSYQSDYDVPLPFPSSTLGTFVDSSSFDSRHLTGLATDGKYLYVHDHSGLRIIGSGYHDTIQGQVYRHNPRYRNNEEVSLVFIHHHHHHSNRWSLFASSYRIQYPRVEAIDINTLEPAGIIQLGEDDTHMPSHPSVHLPLLSDSRYVYSVTFEEEKQTEHKQEIETKDKDVPKVPKSISRDKSTSVLEAIRKRFGSTKNLESKNESSSVKMIPVIYQFDPCQVNLEFPVSVLADEIAPSVIQTRRELAAEVFEALNYSFSLDDCIIALKMNNDDRNLASQFLLQQQDSANKILKMKMVRKIVLKPVDKKLVTKETDSNVRWKWKDGKKWIDFTDNISKILEAAFQKREDCEFDIFSKHYHASTSVGVSMIQTNTETGFSRPIKRKSFNSEDDEDEEDEYEDGQKHKERVTSEMLSSSASLLILTHHNFIIVLPPYSAFHHGHLTHTHLCRVFNLFDGSHKQDMFIALDPLFNGTTSFDYINNIIWSVSTSSSTQRFLFYENRGAAFEPSKCTSTSVSLDFPSFTSEFMLEKLMHTSAALDVPSIAISSPLNMANFIMAHFDRILKSTPLSYNMQRDNLPEPTSKDEKKQLLKAFKNKKKSDISNEDSKDRDRSPDPKAKYYRKSLLLSSFSSSNAAISSAAPFCFEIEIESFHLLYSLIAFLYDYLFSLVNSKDNEANNSQCEILYYSILVLLRALHDHLLFLISTIESEKSNHSSESLSNIMKSISSAAPFAKNELSSLLSSLLSFKYENNYHFVIIQEIFLSSFPLLYPTSEARLTLFKNLIHSSFKDEGKMRFLNTLCSWFSLQPKLFTLFYTNEKNPLDFVEKLLEYSSTWLSASIINSKNNECICSENICSNSNSISYITSISPICQFVFRLQTDIILTSDMLSDNSDISSTTLDILVTWTISVFEACARILSIFVSAFEENNNPTRSEFVLLPSSICSLLPSLFASLSSPSFISQRELLIKISPSLLNLINICDKLVSLTSSGSNSTFINHLISEFYHIHNFSHKSIVETPHLYSNNLNIVDKTVDFHHPKSIISDKSIEKDEKVSKEFYLFNNLTHHEINHLHVVFDEASSTKSSVDSLRLFADKHHRHVLNYGPYFGNAMDHNECWPGRKKDGGEYQPPSIVVEGHTINFYFRAGTRPKGNECNDPIRYGFKAYIRGMILISYPFLFDVLLSASSLSSTIISSLLCGDNLLSEEKKLLNYSAVTPNPSLLSVSNVLSSGLSGISFIFSEKESSFNMDDTPSIKLNSKSQAEIQNYMRYLIEADPLSIIMSGSSPYLKTPETKFFLLFIQDGYSFHDEALHYPELAKIVNSVRFLFPSHRAISNLRDGEKIWNTAVYSIIAVISMASSLSRSLMKHFGDDIDIMDDYSYDDTIERFKVCVKEGKKMQIWMAQQAQELNYWNNLLSSNPLSIDQFKEHYERNTNKLNTISSIKYLHETESSLLLDKLYKVYLSERGSNSAKENHYISIARHIISCCFVLLHYSFSNKISESISIKPISRSDTPSVIKPSSVDSPTLPLQRSMSSDDSLYLHYNLPSLVPSLSSTSTTFMDIHRFTRTASFRRWKSTSSYGSSSSFVPPHQSIPSLLKSVVSPTALIIAPLSRHNRARHRLAGIEILNKMLTVVKNEVSLIHILGSLHRFSENFSFNDTIFESLPNRNDIHELINHQINRFFKYAIHRMTKSSQFSRDSSLIFMTLLSDIGSFHFLSEHSSIIRNNNMFPLISAALRESCLSLSCSKNNSFSHYMNVEWAAYRLLANRCLHLADSEVAEPDEKIHSIAVSITNIIIHDLSFYISYNCERVASTGIPDSIINTFIHKMLRFILVIFISSSLFIQTLFSSSSKLSSSVATIISSPNAFTSSVIQLGLRICRFILPVSPNRVVFDGIPSFIIKFIGTSFFEKNVSSNFLKSIEIEPLALGICSEGIEEIEEEIEEEEPINIVDENPSLLSDLLQEQYPDEDLTEEELASILDYEENPISFRSNPEKAKKKFEMIGIGPSLKEVETKTGSGDYALLLLPHVNIYHLERCIESCIEDNGLPSIISNFLTHSEAKEAFELRRSQTSLHEYKNNNMIMVPFLNNNLEMKKKEEGLQLTSNRGTWSCYGIKSISDGRWYFEVSSLTISSRMNIGIILYSGLLNLIANPGPKTASSFIVGNGKDSWSFDCSSLSILHNGQTTKYGKRVTYDSVVGVMIDLTKHELRFSVNGEDHGMAFSLPTLSSDDFFVPMITVKERQRAIVSFHPKQFRMILPEGFFPLEGDWPIRMLYKEYLQLQKHCYNVNKCGYSVLFTDSYDNIMKLGKKLAASGLSIVSSSSKMLHSFKKVDRKHLIKRKRREIPVEYYCRSAEVSTSIVSFYINFCHFILSSPSVMNLESSKEVLETPKGSSFASSLLSGLKKGLDDAISLINDEKMTNSSKVASALGSICILGGDIQSQKNIGTRIKFGTNQGTIVDFSSSKFISSDATERCVRVILDHYDECDDRKQMIVQESKLSEVEPIPEFSLNIKSLSLLSPPIYIVKIIKLLINTNKENKEKDNYLYSELRCRLMMVINSWLYDASNHKFEGFSSDIIVEIATLLMDISSSIVNKFPSYSFQQLNSIGLALRHRLYQFKHPYLLERFSHYPFITSSAVHSKGVVFDNKNHSHIEWKYGSSNYSLGHTPISSNTTLLLTYWNHHLIPLLHRVCAEWYPPNTIDEYFEQLRLPLVREDQNSAIEIVYIWCDQNLAEGLVFPDFDYDWRRLMIEDIKVGDRVVINPYFQNEDDISLIGKEAIVKMVNYESNLVLLQFYNPLEEIISEKWIDPSLLFSLIDNSNEKHTYFNLPESEIISSISDNSSSLIHLLSRSALMFFFSSDNFISSFLSSSHSDKLLDLVFAAIHEHLISSSGSLLSDSTSPLMDFIQLSLASTISSSALSPSFLIEKSLELMKTTATFIINNTIFYSSDMDHNFDSLCAIRIPEASSVSILIDSSSSFDKPLFFYANESKKQLIRSISKGISSPFIIPGDTTFFLHSENTQFNMCIAPLPSSLYLAFWIIRFIINYSAYWQVVMSPSSNSLSLPTLPPSLISCASSFSSSSCYELLSLMLSDSSLMNMFCSLPKSLVKSAINHLLCYLLRIIFHHHYRLFLSESERDDTQYLSSSISAALLPYHDEMISLIKKEMMESAYTEYLQQLLELCVIADQLRRPEDRLCKEFNFSSTDASGPMTDKAAVPLEWACSVCTLLNTESLSECSVCGTQRPKGKAGEAIGKLEENKDSAFPFSIFHDMLAFISISRCFLGEIPINNSEAMKKLLEMSYQEVKQSIEPRRYVVTGFSPQNDSDILFSQEEIARILSLQYPDLQFKGMEYFYIEYEEEDKIPEKKRIEKAPSIMTFTYKSDGDENGLLYYLGTKRKTASWSNPAEADIVKTSASSLHNKGADTATSTAICGRTAVRCVTESKPNQWFCIDLRMVSFRLSHYSIRHYSSWDTEAVRNWKLEGSNDGIHWTTVDQRHDDTSLKTKGDIKTWKVPFSSSSSSFYRQFRLFQTGKNSNSHLYLACSGIELYGEARFSDDLDSDRVIHHATVIELTNHLNDSQARIDLCNSFNGKNMHQLSNGSFCRFRLRVLNDDTDENKQIDAENPEIKKIKNLYSKRRLFASKSISSSIVPSPSFLNTLKYLSKVMNEEEMEESLTIFSVVIPSLSDLQKQCNLNIDLSLSPFITRLILFAWSSPFLVYIWLLDNNFDHHLHLLHNYNFNEAFEEYVHFFSSFSSTSTSYFIKYLSNLCQVHNISKISELSCSHILSSEDAQTDELSHQYVDSRLSFSTSFLRLHFSVLRNYNNIVAKILPFVFIDASALFSPSSSSSKYSTASISSLCNASRSFIFNSVKINFFESILKETALVQNKVPIVKVDRRTVKLKQLHGETIIFDTDTNFAAAFHQLYTLNPSLLIPPRPRGAEAFIAFEVHFIGEKVVGQGGPYRQFFSDCSAELQSSYSPLFIPSPNHLHHVGEDQDKFLINPSALSPNSLSLFETLGILFGCCIRTGVRMSLNLSTLFWKKLLNISLTLSDLNSFDTTAAQLLETYNTCSADSFDELSLGDQFFVTTLSDGTMIELKDNGAQIPVDFNNRLEYVQLVLLVRFDEMTKQIEAIRKGMSIILPIQLLSLLTSNELMMLVSGTSSINIELLKQHTEYVACSADSAHVIWFWEVVNEFNDELKRNLIRFCWAQERLPNSDEEYKLNHVHFKIKGCDNFNCDSRLPRADTCFFHLELPAYSSKKILKKQLMFAINNTLTMDADEDIRMT